MLTLSGNTQVQSLRGQGTVLKFRKGEIVFRQGDPATHWFEVIFGTVRTCHFFADGHRQLTGFYYPGDAFGVADRVHAATAEAVTDVTVRSFPALTESSGPESHPASLSRKALERALSSAQACISLLGRRTAAERLAAFLVEMSERSADKFIIHLPMSRSDIADHLGLTIHTVSRTLSELVRQNLISLDGPQSIRVVDPPGLCRLAGKAEQSPVRPHAHAPQQAYASR